MCLRRKVIVKGLLELGELVENVEGLYHHDIVIVLNVEVERLNQFVKI